MHPLSPVFPLRHIERDRHSESRGTIYRIIVATFLAAALETGRAQAQSLSPSQLTEIQRLLGEGSEAFRRGDYAAARSSFARMEEINRQAGIDETAASWNISIADIRLTGFQMVTAETPADDARRLNENNRARLETILGFSTLQQIQPTRDNLQDALTRMRAIRDRSQQHLQELTNLPPPINAQERRERTSRAQAINTDLNQTNQAIPFLETTLQRIELRYRELQTTAQQPAINPPQNPVINPIQNPQQNPDHGTPQPPIVSVRTPTYHSERPWALGLGIGGGGVALMGASAITYFATNPQTVGDDRSISTAANALFWTGAAATVTGAVIIVAGERRVLDSHRRSVTILPTIQAQPGNTMIGIIGSF